MNTATKKKQLRVLLAYSGLGRTEFHWVNEKEAKEDINHSETEGISVRYATPSEIARHPQPAATRFTVTGRNQEYRELKSAIFALIGMRALCISENIKCKAEILGVDNPLSAAQVELIEFALFGFYCA